MLGRSSALGLVVAALLAGCGSTSPQQGCSEDVAGTDGIRITYRAQGGAADVRATADILCSRVEGLGGERPAVAVEGDRIVVVVPEDTPDEVIALVSSPGRLAFYDWEAVLLDDDCRADPGRNANYRSPVVGRERAERIAAKCGSGARVVRQERTDPKLQPPDAWWLVRGEPVLTGDEVVDAKQESDPQTNEPIVAMFLDARAQGTFEALTRAIAERGADNALPGTSPLQGSHHFAVVLDDRLMTTPYVNYAENPDGFSGENGVQIAGGFTKESARVLARVLELGPLPVDLLLVHTRTNGG